MGKKRGVGEADPRRQKDVVNREQRYPNEIRKMMVSNSFFQQR